MTESRIRRVRESDVDAVFELVHELAAYERAPKECHLSSQQLHAALFGPSPALFGHVAEVDGDVVGCALWFLNFSTWDICHQRVITVGAVIESTVHHKGPEQRPGSRIPGYRACLSYAG